MDPSKVWINQVVHSKQKMRPKKNKRKKDHRFATESKQPTVAKEASSQQVNQGVGTSSLSFLENISKFTQGLDLVKLRDQISDLNQVFEQVNGVINQISQFHRRPQVPMSGNIGRQPNQPYISYHPYRGYGPYHGYNANYPRHYKGD